MSTQNSTTSILLKDYLTSLGSMCSPYASSALVMSIFGGKAVVIRVVAILKIYQRKCLFNLVRSFRQSSRNYEKKFNSRKGN